MLISVVTPTRNRCARVLRLMDALDRQTFRDFETIVVIDGGTDTTEHGLAGRDVRVLVQPQGGIAKARNRGWRAASGSLVVFADDDVEPAPSWLAQYATAATEHPDTVLQGRVLPNPTEIEGLRGPYARSLEITELSPHFETANILYPRTVLEQLGGFDETLTVAGEDTDLGQRALKAGIDARFVEGAVAYHAVHQQGLRATLRDSSRATDGVRVYRDHPHLREHLEDGVFYDPSHRLLAQAAFGAVLARKRPVMLSFALPYVAHLAHECRRTDAPLSAMPVLALRDAVQIGATLRGAVRHRTFVL
jgi:glycosyltransferase involved in cell wall biosynthesis